MIVAADVDDDFDTCVILILLTCLFDDAIDVGPERLCVDVLHTLNLGSMQKFAQELVWVMFLSSVWCDIRNKTQDEWLDISVIALRADLDIYEGNAARANPEHKPTKVQKLTSTHFGKPSSRTFKVKAAETKVCFYFLHHKIQSVSGRLSQGALWLEAANSLEALLRCMERFPWKLSPQQVKDRVWSYSRNSGAAPHPCSIRQLC